MNIDLSKIAITLLFFAGSFVITAVMSLVSTAGHDFAFWLDTALMTAGLAAVAGFVVDTIRFFASVLWTRKIPFRLKLNKVLKQNLA